MRVIYFWSLSLLLLCCSGVSNVFAATTITYYQGSKTGSMASPTGRNSTANGACVALQSQFSGVSGGFSQGGPASGNCRGTQFGTAVNYGYWWQTTETCSNGNTGLVCDEPPPPPDDPCLIGSGQPTGWKKTWPSYDAYNSDSGKPKCTTSQNGCAVDICGDIGSSYCAESGTTGEFACFGNGTYTGVSQAPSEGGDVEGCEGSACEPLPPTNTTSSKDCTAPQVNGGTTTYTCMSESNSDQWSSSNCSVGTVNGTTGLHCTKPDYVPESNNKTVTDHVTETSNPDGGTTTTKETTTDRTTCKAGQCTTTSTTTTTTTSRDGSGATTGQTTTCQGAKCDDPSTPQDESEEEEEVERSATVGECDAPVSCDGDAIDCAILQEQNALKCEVIKQGDFDAHKTDIESMFQGEQFELETSDIQAPSFINSGTRFLPASCPPPETITLTSNGGHTFAFKYEPLCSFASDFSFLIVTMMGIWCAVYVGRAFGGE